MTYAKCSQCSVRNGLDGQRQGTGHGWVESGKLSLTARISVVNPNDLKLYNEHPPETIRPDVSAITALPDVLNSFEQVTGRSLRYVAGPAPAKLSNLLWSTPVNPGDGIAPGHLILEAGKSESRRSDKETSTKHLATAIGQWLADTLRLKNALWGREAELAAGVPLVPAVEEGRQLARHLESVLKGGAKVIGCQAAALYLLDEGTSQLKLRSCWGLPHHRLADPARPLRGAVADLEALLGHAVVLEDPEVMDAWRVPEDFPGAVCVPVSTATTVLGTLWMFSSQARTFSNRQTHIVEIVAGRVAADLERQMLLNAGISGARLQRQLSAAEQLQREQLPMTAPRIDGWDVGAWAAQGDQLGGTFFDWFTLPDGQLAMALGDAAGTSVEAALTAAAVKTSLRCYAPHQSDPTQVLAEIDRALWTGAAGSQQAALRYVVVEPAAEKIRWSNAGCMGMMIIDAQGVQSQTKTAGSCSDVAWGSKNYSLLGENPVDGFTLSESNLHADQILVIATEGVIEAINSQGQRLGESGLADFVKSHISLPAQDIANLIRRRLEAFCRNIKHDDWGILVVRRDNGQPKSLRKKPSGK